MSGNMNSLCLEKFRQAQKNVILELAVAGWEGAFQTEKKKKWEKGTTSRGI